VLTTPETEADVKALLVDDREENLFALQVTLAQPGVQLLTARSGRDALELLLQHEFAVAILDVHMPDMDGLELAELMRGAERTREVPIIFVTAAIQDAERTFRGYEAGAVDFLYKPLDPAILRHKVNTFVALDRQRRALACELERRRASEEFLARVLESSADRIEVLHRDGYILFRKGASDARLAPEAGARWVDQWHEDSRATAHEAIETARAGRVGQFAALRRASERHGGTTYWDVSVSAIRDASGRPEKLLAISRDVTARKHGEDERARLLEEVQGLLRSNEMFVAILGHDLRSPLSAVATGARLLTRTRDLEIVRRTAERIVSSSLRMGEMIEQLLDFTRMREGQAIPLAHRPLDFAELVGTIVEEARHANPDARIAIVAEGDAHGTWDGSRLAQVISNLVANALQHGDPAHGVRLHVDGTTAGAVRLHVSNRGTIPPAVLPVLFEPFRRPDQPASQRAGLGLGLFIAQRIAIAHGGRIDVASDEARTTFTVSLPREPHDGTAEGGLDVNTSSALSRPGTP
jgi:signal transduction histidine kinase